MSNESSSRAGSPSRRQIIFNWLMQEDDFATKKDGYWGGTEEVAHADALLAALDAVAPVSEQGASGKGSAAEALSLFEWAEKHPELTMKVIGSWWATCGRGAREVNFNFRACIRDAIAALPTERKGS